MKSTVVLYSLVLTSLALTSTLKADTLASWTFDTTTITSTGSNITNLLADVGSGTASGHHTSASTTYSAPAGNGSTKSFSANTWAIGDYWQYAVNLDQSSSSYSSIAVSYDQTGSPSGPGKFYFAYSANGISYTPYSGTITDYTLPGGSWSPSTASTTNHYSFDLSAVTALNTASTIYFRIVDDSTTSIGNGTVGTAGTDRTDNFLVTSLVTVPEPTTVALAVSGGLACLVAIKRRR